DSAPQSAPRAESAIAVNRFVRARLEPCHEGPKTCARLAAEGQFAPFFYRGNLRREKTSVSQEDYLKAIWELVQEEQAPISARLAEDLGVTPPAVTAALKRMTRGGYLRVHRSGHIELSSKGRKLAEHLVLRHRLAEKL